MGRELLACFLAGLAWAWAEQRDFLLIFAALGVAAVALGAWTPSLPFLAGGLALFLALAAACIVYGSHR